MPQQVNAGLTFYLLEGLPLRLTLDAQWIEWSQSAEKPIFPGDNGFEDALNFSIGAEYRIAIGETLFLYPRLGFRRFDAPWDDKDDLPSLGGYRLVLNTDSDVFNVFSYGIGVSWSTEEGKIRSVDIAGDAGADSVNVAVGYTHEF